MIQEPRTAYTSVKQQTTSSSTKSNITQYKNLQVDSAANQMLETSSCHTQGRLEGSDQSVIPSYIQNQTSISAQSTTPSSLWLDDSVVKLEQTPYKPSWPSTIVLDESTEDHKPSSMAEHANTKVHLASVDWDETANRDDLIATQNRVMSFGCPPSKSYEKVSVLLLSWDAESDDLGVQEEVDALGAVFQDISNFEVQSTRLTSHSVRKQQAHINYAISKWVYDNDAANTLLIVYYGGHASIGDAPGDLELSGKSSSNAADSQANRDRVLWNMAESVLFRTQADVLEILDCCYAGSLGMNRCGYPLDPLTSMASGSTSLSLGNNRLFASVDRLNMAKSRLECIAATSSGLTPSPGETSFTSALIWALKTLSLDNGYFTTMDLLDQIILHTPNLHHGINPILSSYTDNPCNNHITFKPLRFSKKAVGSRSAEESPQNAVGDRKNFDLKLKFSFGRQATENEVALLGKELNSLLQKKFPLARVDWKPIERK